MHSFRHCQNCQIQSNKPQTWSFSGFLNSILFSLFQQKRIMLKSCQNNHPCSQSLSHASHCTLNAQFLAVVSKALQGRAHHFPSYLVLCYCPRPTLILLQSLWPPGCLSYTPGVFCQRTSVFAIPSAWSSIWNKLIYSVLLPLSSDFRANCLTILPSIPIYKKRRTRPCFKDYVS